MLPRELLEIIDSFLNISSSFALSYTSKCLSNGPYTMVKVNEVIDDAIEYPDIFKWLIPDTSCLEKQYFKQLCTKVVMRSSFEIVKYMPNDSWFYIKPDIICVEAIKQGRLDILQWLHDKYATFVLSNAELFPYDNSDDNSDDNDYDSEESSQVELYVDDSEYDFRLHHKHIKPLHTTWPYIEAARYGHLDILQWLKSQGYEWNQWTLSEAAKHGHFEIVIYLYENGCQWNFGTLPYAAAGGHFEIILYLHEKGCPLDSWTFANAVVNGNLEILHWLHDRNCPTDSTACEHAAKNGRLDILKWLRLEVNCPWNEGACIEAVQNKHFEILKWLHDNGCPWNKYCCHYAAENGDLEVLKYLYQNGCPIDKLAFHAADKKGNREILNYLLQI